jgi:hypothetical protein
VIARSNGSAADRRGSVFAAKAAANEPTVYRAWRGSYGGRLVWDYVLAQAQQLLRTGELRVSVNALVEQARAKFHVDVNNTYRAWLADDLVREEPRLVNVIERRQRKKARA